ncbi:MAG TPA: SigE family RNA polymerase sigma factor [Actinomycetota bacterium]|nr:SigE family RNA polymerase sigma factor [Actinomycetota bacterium]
MDIDAENVVTAAGGRARLEELYRVQVAPLQRLAFLLTSDHHLAEDITQQAFVRFYRRFFALRDPAAAPAYLRRTVVNLARSHHRRGRRERDHLEVEQRTPETTDDPSLEDHDMVVRAVRSLPYRQRAAIVLRFYEDLTEQQAAEALGCSTAAMKSLTARAMSSLRGMDIRGGTDED